MIRKQNRVYILSQIWSHKHVYRILCITLVLILTLNSTEVFFLTKKQIIAKITIQQFHKEEKLILRNGAAAAAAKSLQLCLTLCDPIDGSPPGSSIPGILQEWILEWVAISFSNACTHGKSLQPCPTPCDPMDSSPPCSWFPPCKWYLPVMEQQTGSKLGKKYVKAVYCHPAYLT